MEKQRSLTYTLLKPLFIILLIIYPLLVGLNPYYVRVMFFSLLLANISMAWSILAVAGQVSFGHAAFFGLAAYVTGLLAVRLGIPPPLSIPVAVLFSTAVVGGVVAVTFRLREVYFALAMLAYAEILKYIVINTPEITGGSLGLLNIPPLGRIELGSEAIDFSKYIPLYYLFLALTFIVAYVMTRIMNSRIGVALKAISRDELAAESCGINVFKYKVIALIVSAIITSSMGAIYAHINRFLYPEVAFSMEWSIFPIIASLFAGYEISILGPAIGAVILYTVKEFFISRLMERGYEIIYGLLLVFVLLVLRKGVLDYIIIKVRELRLGKVIT